VNSNIEMTIEHVQIAVIVEGSKNFMPLLWHLPQ